MKKRLFAALLCVVFVLALAGCGGSGRESQFTLKVTHGDGTEFETKVTTKKDTLGEALLDEEIIVGEDGPYGLYVKTVDGETADETRQQWWCLTKDGENVNTGVDSTVVEGGVTYEFTLMEGY